MKDSANRKRGAAWKYAIWAGFLLALTAAGQDRGEDLLPPPGRDRSFRVALIREAFQINNLDQAEKTIAELMAREPDNYEGAFWSGFLALRRLNYYGAIRALRRAEALQPNPSVLKTLAVSYYGAHQMRLFLLTMREAITKQPDDFAPYYYLGRYYDTDLTDFSKAAQYFEQALARNPDHFRAHYYLGHCLEAEQKMEPAEAEYRRAMELGSHDGLPYQGLARLRLAANRPADALPLAQRAVELGPRDAASHRALARAYSDLGKEDEAATEWNVIAALDPTDAVALYRLYRSYRALGELGKANEALARYKKVAALYGTN